MKAVKSKNIRIIDRTKFLRKLRGMKNLRYIGGDASLLNDPGRLKEITRRFKDQHELDSVVRTLSLNGEDRKPQSVRWVMAEQAGEYTVYIEKW
jgi:hypothetical protein